MTAGILIDSWKLAIFKRHLDAAGYTYTEHPGVASGLLTLKVTYLRASALSEVVTKANAECQGN